MGIITSQTGGYLVQFVYHFCHVVTQIFILCSHILTQLFEGLRLADSEGEEVHCVL